MIRFKSVSTGGMTSRNGLGDLDANTVGDSRVFSVDTFAAGTLQFAAVSGAWASAVLTVERSNDGLSWYAMSPSAVTANADSMTNTLDLSGILYLRVRVSTANGAALVVRVTACFKGE